MADTKIVRKSFREATKKLMRRTHWILAEAGFIWKLSGRNTLAAHLQPNMRWEITSAQVR
jgi:cytochrome b subunit of formate dehydrogenase